MKRPSVTASVRAIAAEAGVSIATVSRVLNGHANVTASTRERVNRAATLLSRPIRVQRLIPASVYVRCPYVLSDYFGLIVSSIAEALEPHGRRLVLDAGEPAQTAHSLRQLPAKPEIGGAIIILPPEGTDEIVKLRDSRFPFVVVDPRQPLPDDIVAVSAAHFSGAQRMTQHLIELGHRRIGVIAGPSEWMATDARLAGHHAALVRIGRMPEHDLVSFVHPTIDDGYRAARKLLDRRDRPTALVGFNDKIAVGALHAAAERGLRVPADLSITGFDDIELARATQPKLTTVAQPLQEMGRMAVTLLIRLQERTKLDALHVDLATKLVVRDSTGPAPR